MVFLICTFEGDSAVLNINESDSLRGMKQFLCVRWTSLSEDQMNLFYSIPEHDNCLLLKDEDVGIMLALANSLGVSRIQGYVVSTNVNVGSGSCSMVASSSTLSVVSFSDSESEDSDLDLLRTFCPRKEDKQFSINWDKCVEEVGQKFVGGAVHFRKALCKMSISTGFDFVYLKNDDKRIKAVCAHGKDTGCAWMVSAKKEIINGFFYVKKFHDLHTCGTSYRSFKGHRMNSVLVSELVCNEVRNDPLVRPIAVKRRLFSDHGLHVSYYNAWTGVSHARNEMFGDVKESFNFLTAYLSNVSETNPGSYVALEVDAVSHRFKRVFVAFHACIEGFKHCRPLLCLDGAHLKSQYKGQLLSAVSKDGDQGLFPVCFAVVDSENTDNWHWFFTNLKKIVD